MAAAESLARYWLTPAANSFWQWSEDGEAVCWNGGPTIILRRELQLIISWLPKERLPPASALFWLLGACRPDWRENAAHVKELGRYMSRRMAEGRYEWLRQLADEVDEISELAKVGLAAQQKAALARLVFESCEVSEPEVTDRVVALLDGRSTELFEGRAEDHEPIDDWWVDLRWLRYGLETLDLSRFDEFLATGLTSLPTPAEGVEPPDAVPLRQLLESLANDDELSGVVRLTKRLMAAVSLPRSVSDPDEMPTGGLSDISNRGSFDRLLLTELASDADLLTVRVAHNEALYLRREAPPRTPPESRIVLIDTGIRMWGLPRIYATATALAFAINARSSATVQFCRSAGKVVEPVQFRTRDDLLRHLEVLETDVHPGRALAGVERLVREADADGAAIITSDDALADPEFCRLLDESSISEWTIAAVSRSGEFELITRRQGGSKSLASLQLDLEAILEPQSGKRQDAMAASLVNEDADPNLPAALRVEPFPFRLPHPLHASTLWQVGDEAAPNAGVLAITHDRRLVFWNEKNRGPLQLMSGVPTGEVAWTWGDRHGKCARAVVRHGKQFQLLKIEFVLNQHPIANVVPLDCTLKKVRGVCGNADTVYLIGKSQVAEYHDDPGPRFVLNLPRDCTWIRDRFFQVERTVQALASSGGAVSFEEVPFLKSTAKTKFSVWPSDYHTFDCPSIDGPAYFSGYGAVIRFDGAIVVRKMSPSNVGKLRILDVSPTGKTILSEDRSKTRCLTRLANARTERYYGPPAAIDENVMPVLSSVDMTGRIRWVCLFHDAIAVSGGGHSVRVFNLRDLHQFPARERYDSVLKRRLREPSCLLQFNKGWRAKGRRWKLSKATTPDGTRVTADSRGLLHFQSSNPDVPEISIALAADFRFAAWTSRGLQAGDQFFFSPWFENHAVLNESRKEQLAGELQRLLQHVTLTMDDSSDGGRR